MASIEAGRRHTVKRSNDHILTTHTGSLPRPDDLAKLMFAKEDGLPAPGLDQRVPAAVTENGRRQAAICLDGLNDGEISQPPSPTHAQARPTALGGESPR